MAVLFKFMVSVKSGHCDYFHPDAKRPSYATDSNADKCEICRHAYVSVMETVVQLLRNTTAVSRSHCSTLKCISEYSRVSFYDGVTFSNIWL